MKITCPNCQANFEVDAKLIPEIGRDVKCSQCTNVWRAMPIAEVVVSEIVDTQNVGAMQALTDNPTLRTEVQNPPSEAEMASEQVGEEKAPAVAQAEETVAQAVGKLSQKVNAAKMQASTIPALDEPISPKVDALINAEVEIEAIKKNRYKIARQALEKNEEKALNSHNELNEVAAIEPAGDVSADPETIRPMAASEPIQKWQRKRMRDLDLPKFVANLSNGNDPELPASIETEAKIDQSNNKIENKSTRGSSIMTCFWFIFWLLVLLCAVRYLSASVAEALPILKPYLEFYSAVCDRVLSLASTVFEK